MLPFMVAMLLFLAGVLLFMGGVLTCARAGHGVCDCQVGAAHAVPRRNGAAEGGGLLLAYALAKQSPVLMSSMVPCKVWNCNGAYL